MCMICVATCNKISSRQTVLRALNFYDCKKKIVLD